MAYRNIIPKIIFLGISWSRIASETSIVILQKFIKNPAKASKFSPKCQING